jgi:hypothetical protein
VRVEAVEQLPPVQLDALVVVTERFQGPAWAWVARRARAIAMRIRVIGSTSVGRNRSISLDRLQEGSVGKSACRVGRGNGLRAVAVSGTSQGIFEDSLRSIEE